MKKTSTSIVLLACNEAENLKTLLPQIHEVALKMGIDYEIIIIDAARPMDRTEEVARENHARYIRQEEPHYGGAFRTGIRYASGSRMIVLDADRSHDPRDIPAICKKFEEGYDMVIGSRYVKGGASNDSRASFAMSRLLNAVMRIAMGVKAKDVSTSYRLYDMAQVREVVLTRDNYDVLQEVILRMKVNKRRQRQPFRIGEVPIVFHKRMYGESKRQLWKFMKGYMVTACMLLFMNIRSFCRDR